MMNLIVQGGKYNQKTVKEFVQDSNYIGYLLDKKVRPDLIKIYYQMQNLMEEYNTLNVTFY